MHHRLTSLAPRIKKWALLVLIFLWPNISFADPDLDEMWQVFFAPLFLFPLLSLVLLYYDVRKNTSSKLIICLLNIISFAIGYSLIDTSIKATSQRMLLVLVSMNVVIILATLLIRTKRS